MRVRFLGTGAADWKGPDERGERRRYSSVLIDDRLLIDCTPGPIELLPDGVRITDILFTHSHGDHYRPAAAMLLHPARVWTHESWTQDALRDGLPAYPLRFGETTDVSGYQVTALPTNHLTDRVYEQTCGYAVEHNGKRFLYWTDGAWVPRRAAALLRDMRFDLVMLDGTFGPLYNDGWLLFEHNSLSMAQKLIRCFRAEGVLKPDAPAYLTHLSRVFWPAQAEAERAAAPLSVAHDGLEIDI